MKQLSVFLMSCLFSFGLVSAQDKDDRNMRSYQVADFNKIAIEGNYRVYLFQTSSPYLKIKAPSDDMYDAIDVQSDGRSLKLSVRKNGFNLSKIELHIGFRELEELHIAGGFKIKTDGYVEVRDLKILAEGGVNVDLKMKAQSIEVISNGGAIFDMAGVTERFFVKVAGAGHVNAREMVAREVTFRVEGVGFGSVHATELLDVKIEGVGKVTYNGDPEVKRIIEGLGKVVSD